MMNSKRKVKLFISSQCVLRLGNFLRRVCVSSEFQLFAVTLKDKYVNQKQEKLHTNTHRSCVEQK